MGDDDLKRAAGFGANGGFGVAAGDQVGKDFSGADVLPRVGALVYDLVDLLDCFLMPAEAGVKRKQVSRALERLSRERPAGLEFFNRFVGLAELVLPDACGGEKIVFKAAAASGGGVGGNRFLRVAEFQVEI